MDRKMYSFSNMFPGGEQLQPFKPGCALCTITDGLDIAILLKKGEKKNNPMDSCLISSNRIKLNRNLCQDSTPELLSSGTLPSPMASACGPTDWPKIVHQAKRARVENIIRDMAVSSKEPMADGATDGLHKKLENVQGIKGTQEWPQDGIQAQGGGRNGTSYWSSEDLAMRNQLLNKCQPLAKFQTGFPQEEWGRKSEMNEVTWEQNYPICSDSPSTFPNDTLADPNNDFEIPLSRKRGQKQVRVTNNRQSKSDKVHLLTADILKYELSRAVNMSVDSVFKSIPLLEVSPRSVQTDILHHSPIHSHQQLCLCEEAKSGPPACEERVLAVSLPEFQTEALSLVVQRPLQPTPCGSSVLPISRAHHYPKPLYPFSNRTGLREDPASECPQNGSTDDARCFKQGCDAAGRPTLETLNASCNLAKVRCKVNSRSIRGPQTHHCAADSILLESGCLPDIKTKADSLQSMVFSLNEGLTTSHLKKAKRMFFYTRYPSSQVLKNIFFDVQFTRCITSQLIKWFSNFREFYYIQMEKSARHAIMERVVDARVLTVGRESELFRALNMHYNKANDFQVPNRFLEVAELTLREFYIAISMGKDRDPSWKKPIYKVICKLDSEVPREFKTRHSE